MASPQRLLGALDILSTLMVLVAGCALLWKLFLAAQPSAPNPAQPQVEEIDGTRIESSTVRHVVGNGPIAIVAFSDFQCPFCGQFARQVWPEIKRRLVDSGKARYISLHFPLERIHPHALQASEAAECAGVQGYFWPMYDMLYNDSAAITMDGVMNIARSLGLESASFERCIANHDHLTRIRSDQAEGRRLGVLGTPAFFVGAMLSDGGVELKRIIRGAAPVDVFAEQVQEVRESRPIRTSRLR